MQFTSTNLNIKIIEGVRQLPCLHSNNDNLYERNEAWVQLAEKLKMPEQFLKIRWHGLLHGYQNDVNFKYAKLMNFICRNTERKTKDNWPEFIITEEYLKDDNPEEQEQFVLLDTDEEEINSKTDKSSKDKECTFKDTSVKIEKNTEFENKSHEENVTAKEMEESNVSTEPYPKQSDDVKISPSPKKICVSIAKDLNVEEKLIEIENKENEMSITNAVEELNEKSKPLIAERCEDVIFGELVSAMLKRMDESKKKHIKREIMNLLFS